MLSLVMRVIPNDRALAQWAAITKRLPELFSRFESRLAEEQPEMIRFVHLMIVPAEEIDSSPLADPPDPATKSPAARLLLWYAAGLYELFLRESGRPLRRIPLQELEDRWQRQLLGFLDSPEPRSASSLPQPGLFLGVRISFRHECLETPENSVPHSELLLRLIVEAFDDAATHSDSEALPPADSWTADRIEDALRVAGDPMRIEALAAADRFRETLIPRFIAALDSWQETPDGNPEGDDAYRIHALFLLGRWREPSARSPLIRLLQRDADSKYGLLGDLSWIYGAVLMASLHSTSPEALMAIATDSAAGERARSFAIAALGCLTAWNELSRETLVEYIRSLFHGGLKPRSAPDVWRSLVHLVIDAELRELLLESEAAVREERIEPESLTVEEIRAVSSLPVGRAWSAFVNEHPPIGDIAAVTAWLDEPVDYGDFDETENSTPGFLNILNKSLGRDDQSDLPIPYRAPESVGRNDPCPCGSGKKFKKCCGA